LVAEGTTTTKVNTSVVVSVCCDWALLLVVRGRFCWSLPEPMGAPLPKSIKLWLLSQQHSTTKLLISKVSLNSWVNRDKRSCVISWAVAESAVPSLLGLIIQVHTYSVDILCYDSVCDGILTRILLFFQVLLTSKIEQKKWMKDDKHKQW
jgi:hypothetical protein